MTVKSELLTLFLMFILFAVIIPTICVIKSDVKVVQEISIDLLNLIENSKATA